MARSRQYSASVSIRGEALFRLTRTAAAITAGRVEVAGLTADSRQGDAGFLDLLERMGCAVERRPGSVIVEGPAELRGIDADLVVLSACETGKGHIYRAEGIVGLTRAFLHAGTPTVLCRYTVRGASGVLVVAESRNATSGYSPLRSGDVVYGINTSRVASVDDIRALIAAVDPGAPLIFQVQRQNRLRYLTGTRP